MVVASVTMCTVVVQLLSCVHLFVTPQTAACQTSLSSIISQICLRSCPLSQWCHLTISSSVTPFSSCPQSFPATVFSNESALRIKWPKYWSFSISPSNQYSGLNSFRIDCLISLMSKGFSGVFSNTAVQKHQFFGPQLSLWSNSHIHTCLLVNHSIDYMDLC